MPKVSREKKEKVDDYISTGLTELDLNISGGVTRYGGIKAGSMVEIVGPAGIGKTGLLLEIAASILNKKGIAQIADAENRANENYLKYFHIDKKNLNLYVPKTVEQMEDKTLEFWNEHSDFDGWLISGVDSVAALTSQMDLDGKDKMGGAAAAKLVNRACRKLTKDLGGTKRLLVWINQQRVDFNSQKMGKTSGQGLNYYCDLRLIVRKSKPYKIAKTKTIKGVPHEKIVGINTTIEVEKSSIDDPFATCKAPIIFRYGLDDIRNNIEYYKKNMKHDKYVKDIDGCEGKSFIDDARKFIEEKPERVVELREKVVDLWHDIFEAFKDERAVKMRF